MTEPHPRERVIEAATIAALSVVSVGVCLPILQSGDQWGYWDWDIFEAQLEGARRSVVEYAQWPGWNPHIRGGQDLASHPLLPLASPAFAAVLALGTLPGIKLWLVVRQIAALVGAYLLGRRLDLGRSGALTVAVIFGLSSCYAQRVAHGHWNLAAFVYLPWVIYASLGAVEKGAWRARSLAAFWLALMFLDGGPYAFALGWLGLATVALSRPWPLLPAGLVSLAWVAALALAIAGVKLVPVALAYGGGARELPAAVGDFYFPDFVPSFGEFLYAALLDRAQAARPGRFETFHSNVGAYVGVLGLGLAGLGAFLGGRLGRVAWLFALPVLWLCLGASAPVDLWQILHRLPVVASMTVPAKFTAFYLLALAVAAGAGVAGLERRFVTSRPRRVALYAVVAVLAADLVVVSRPLLAQAFPFEAMAVERGSFHQVSTSPYWEAYAAHQTQQLARRPGVQNEVYTSTADYPAVLANLGVLVTFGGKGRIEDVRATPDRDGELGAWIETPAGARRARLSSWSPNAMRFELPPGPGGLLVVNQNHAAGWTAESGTERFVVEPDPASGRLAVRVPASARSVTLRFRSGAARAGQVLSLLGLTAAIALALWQTAGRARRPVQSR